MVIDTRDGRVDIQTTDGVWFNMTSDQMEEIRLGIEIIQNIQASGDIDNCHLNIKAHIEALNPEVKLL